MNRALNILLLAALLQSSLAFTVSPAVNVVSRQGVVRFATTDDKSDEPEVPAPFTTPVPAAPKQGRTLDPLVASLTRIDPNAKVGKMRNVPLLGEIDVEGSLGLLVPAAVIAVVGFLMSFVVAFNSRDTFVEQLTRMSEGIDAAALAKTNVVPAVDNGCRGLCSDQGEQLESMRSFMEGLAKK